MCDDTIIRVCLNDIPNVHAFCNICSKTDCEIDVKSGRYTIDGKSIMGLFSLDLSKTLNVHIRAVNQSEAVALSDELKTRFGV